MKSESSAAEFTDLGIQNVPSSSISLSASLSYHCLPAAGAAAEPAPEPCAAAALPAPLPTSVPVVGGAPPGCWVGFGVPALPDEPGCACAPSGPVPWAAPLSAC